MIRNSLLGLALYFALGTGPSIAQDAPVQTLFTNVHIFDGVNEKRIKNANVLIEGNLIKTVSTKAIDAPGANTIDGGGRTLMPGLIDAHVHLTHARSGGGLVGMENSHWQYIGAMSAYMAKESLLNGFTTVREIGGGSVGPGVKKAVDEGWIEGPRIYPSGAYISQTSGHGDFLSYGQRHQEDTNLGRLEISVIADGSDEVQKAVRRNLAMGASQIKLMVSGGVSSLKDPLHSNQYTNEEIQAAVQAAAAWDTYVAAHVYDDANVRRALENGVLSIEHGQFITKPTAKLLKKLGAFHSINFAAINPILFNHPVYGDTSSPVYAKAKQFQAGSGNLKKVLNDVGQKVVFNSDQVFTLGVDYRRGLDFEKYAIADYIGNHRALMAMTSTAGELMALTGKQNPYPNKLGVIEVGAYADILLVDGNPLEDMSVIGADSGWFDAPARGMDIPTIRLIMKNGQIYKNSVQ